MVQRTTVELFPDVSWVADPIAWDARELARSVVEQRGQREELQASDVS